MWPYLGIICGEYPPSDREMQTKEKRGMEPLSQAQSICLVIFRIISKSKVLI